MNCENKIIVTRLPNVKPSYAADNIPLSSFVLPLPAIQDAISVLNANGDGSWGEEDVQLTLAGLQRYNQILQDKIQSNKPNYFLERLTAPAPTDQEETIQRLRGQLQNCVNHLEREKRSYGEGQKAKERLEACIESANKCLYETLNRS